jgi:hypothetical protein
MPTPLLHPIPISRYHASSVVCPPPVSPVLLPSLITTRMPSTSTANQKENQSPRKRASLASLKANLPKIGVPSPSIESENVFYFPPIVSESVFPFEFLHGLAYVLISL